MKAIQIHSYGDSGQLKVEEVSRPVPKLGELLVKVRAAGVNPIDWKIRKGFLKEVMPRTFPLTLGQDFAGEVVSLGSDITRFKIGDRVLGSTLGAYAEFVIARADKTAKFERLMSFETAAAIPTAGVTAYQALFQVSQLQRGQTILIHGAAGGVGYFAIQLSKHLGARIFATASATDAEFLKKAGAEQVIDYRNERFEEKANNVDVVLDLIGGETLLRSYAVVKPSGMIVTTVGPIDENQAESRGIRAVHFVMKQNSEDLEILTQLVEEGVIQVRVSKTFPLDQAREAQDLNEKGLSHGKLILKVA